MRYIVNQLLHCFKQSNFFYSHPSTLPEDAPAKFYFSTIFGLSFMISSVAPTRSSTFYAYLITKIGNRNVKVSHNRKKRLKLVEKTSKMSTMGTMNDPNSIA